LGRETVQNRAASRGEPTIGRHQLTNEKTQLSPGILRDLASIST